MLNDKQIQAILASPGSYVYWCVMSAYGDPFWAHTPVGRVLHTVTESERDAMRERANRF